ncbi:hypothetical protein [Candidatus Paracaedibacter symbiosus]|uniref:hypothetical protein n=1 Tax=Candidatus Paracaedibacter symbiosus TaxID=244582 RepID=UPI00068F2279|nr:hypothetical protein [Candidatus Paracaedibacter symbiosus]
MQQIQINPHLYKQFGENKGCHFRLLTNSQLKDSFTINKGDYESAELSLFDTAKDFKQIVLSLPRPIHILIISPYCMTEFPRDEEMGEDYKLMTLPCSSSEIDLESIRYYLEVMERTDLDAQKEWSNNFFAVAEKSKHLKFVDTETKTEATFYHMSDEYEWFEQLGMIPWGGQQFVPSGEISVFSLFHNPPGAVKNINITGEITFSGYSIVNSGNPSFLEQDRERIYNKLSSLMKGKIIFEIQEGRLNPKAVHCDKEAQEAYDILQSLFEVDSRYNLLWEIGFGANTNMEALQANRTPNEVYGHRNGCIHWGLGLTPRTQYHLDIICPNTIVMDDQGTIITGGDKKKL